MPAGTTTVYVATDEGILPFYELRANHPVVLLATWRRLKWSGLAPSGNWPPKDVLLQWNQRQRAGLLASGNVAGHRFTGAWFSTYTGLINRWRGYGGFADSSSYFSTPGRFNAWQGFEKPRSPLYMREWVEGWRGIDSDQAAAPRPGERVFVDGAYD